MIDQASRTVGRSHVSLPSPATAYWNQRRNLARSSARLRVLRNTLNDPVNLSSHQWAQLFAYVREFKPDVIVELGRGNGNSTAALNEALYQNQHGALISLCNTTAWSDRSRPLIRSLVEPDWFDRLDARVGDIGDTDFAAIVESAQRVFVFWDAHGFRIAEAVLGGLMPLLQDRAHVVVMHDVSDVRYCGADLAYGDAGLWQGTEWVERHQYYHCRLCIGWISTIVEQVIAVLDFLTRNRADLHSADHCFHQELSGDTTRVHEMATLLAPEDWSLVAHWAFFSLNDVPGPYTFPKILSRGQNSGTSLARDPSCPRVLASETKSRPEL